MCRAAEFTVPSMATKLTPEKKIAFLAALAETGNVSRAAKAIDVARITVYEWRDEDEEFAAAWEKAKRIGMGLLEDEVLRRAHDGTEKPVFHQGLQCGTIREYSDTLAIFLLKAHDPKYREKTGLELTGANGGPVQMSDSQVAGRLAALIAVAQARQAQEASDEPGADLV
ncbi:Uncharacterised protein [Achromobacter sp. 2789STDY5608615]|nr:Uncharacterised protein [Achromobacter sp. 2789STDY5608615]